MTKLSAAPTSRGRRSRRPSRPSGTTRSCSYRKRRTRVTFTRLSLVGQPGVGTITCNATSPPATLKAQSVANSSLPSHSQSALRSTSVKGLRSTTRVRLWHTLWRRRERRTQASPRTRWIREQRTQATITTPVLLSALPCTDACGFLATTSTTTTNHHAISFPQQTWCTVLTATRTTIRSASCTTKAVVLRKMPFRRVSGSSGRWPTASPTP